MTDTITNEQYWNSRYGESDQMWSGQPNAALVREVGDRAPGTALDLGCGEGADAIWLAQQGWRVIASDISQVVLDRASARAAALGTTGIDWRRHDFAISIPAGSFDLVSAQYLHSNIEIPREQILRKAAGAVSPGGILLIVGHAGISPWEHEDGSHDRLPTTDEVLTALDLRDGEWEVLRSEEFTRTQTGPDGEQVTRTDNTLKIRRLAD